MDEEPLKEEDDETNEEENINQILSNSDED